MTGESGDGSETGSPGGQGERDSGTDLGDRSSPIEAETDATTEPSPGRAEGSSSIDPDRKESLTAVLSKPNTKSQIEVALLYYAAVGVGVGLSMYSTVSVFGGGLLGSVVGRIIAVGGLVSALAIGPALGGPLGLYVAHRLRAEETDRQLYATAGFGAFGGHVLMVVVVIVFISLGSSGGGGGGFDIDQTLRPIVFGGFGAAVAAVGAAYAMLTAAGDERVPAVTATDEDEAVANTQIDSQSVRDRS